MNGEKQEIWLDQAVRSALLAVLSGEPKATIEREVYGSVKAYRAGAIIRIDIKLKEM